jgi:hypothetical protein
MFESFLAGRYFILARRAVVAWETMAEIMRKRWDEEQLAREKSKPRPAEFGTLNIEEANKNWRLQQAGRMIDEDDEDAG